MSLVTDLVLARFITLYGDPKTDSIENYVAEYEKALGSYSGKVLTMAADLVIKKQEFRSWPTPGECVTAAIYAQMIVVDPKPAPSQSELDKQAQSWPAPTDESKARVRSLVDIAKAVLKKNAADDDLKPPVSQRGLSETTKRMLGEAGE